MSIDIKAFFDEATNTVSYVVADSKNDICAIIDSVLDFDNNSGRTSTKSADEIIKYVNSHKLHVEWILETHVHADHLTAAPYLKAALGGKTGIGKNITVVQETFGKLFNAEGSFCTDGSQFDHLFDDDEEFNVGSISARAIHTPGHTPACMTYVIGDAGFVGDTLFMPDYGTARCDFPGGDAKILYASVQKIFALSNETKLFMCHDYKAPNRDAFAWETTVGEEKADNVHIHQGVTVEDFVAMRNDRDATLDVPRLILPSVQVNMRAGELPPEESNGQRYLKIPLNVL